MRQLLEQKIVQPSKVTGLEISFLPDHKLLINGVTVVLNKKQIITETALPAVSNIDDLVKKLKKDIPLSVVFNGKGIIAKQTGKIATGDHPLSAVLPNANPGDFYHTSPEEQSNPTVAVGRKDQADEILIQLKEKGFKILQASLGFEMMQNILPFMRISKDNVIETNSFILSANSETGISGFERRDHTITDKFQLPEYQVGKEYVHGSNLLAFAAAVQLITDDLQTAPGIGSLQVSNERTDFRYSRFVRAGGIGILAIAFILLLINFLVYNHYFNKNKTLQSEHSVSQNRQDKEKIILQHLKKQEALLQGGSWFQSSRISFYADRIASLTPNNTVLSSLNINPSGGSYYGEFPVIHFKTDTIQLAGSTGNAVEVNQFMHNLKLIDAFNTVSLRNYAFKKETETGTFLIEIITK